MYLPLSQLSPLFPLLILILLLFSELIFYSQKRLIDKRVGVTAETVEKGTVIIGYRSCTCLDCISLLFTL